jgi:hypothetical protein
LFVPHESLPGPEFVSVRSMWLLQSRRRQGGDLALGPKVGKVGTMRTREMV